jgi:hypothetical protein
VAVAEGRETNDHPKGEVGVDVNVHKWPQVRESGKTLLEPELFSRQPLM